MIDVHSDTVTQPTIQMRLAMLHAEVGDDVSCEDPTVIKLENRVANMFQKDAALFFPSGTMSNLAAVLTWCNSRGSEMIVGDKSHMFLFEQGGAAQFGGVSSRTVRNLADGTMDLSDVNAAIRDDDIHEPTTQLICVENTHNACGGQVLPLYFLEGLRDLAVKRNLPIHMDGARIWNALTASGKEAHEVAQYVDSLSVCLSKGLGCPIGSLLVGPREFIEKARRIRKALGGGMRQVGIVAAAGLIALDDFVNGILLHDHIHTSSIAKSVANMRSFRLMTSIVETNILFLEVADAAVVGNFLKARNIVVSVWSPTLIRIVLHRDIDEVLTNYIIEMLHECNAFLVD